MGHFITFEGGEGAGKTSLIRLLSEKLQAHGQACIVTREPGGIPIAEQIRHVILDPVNTEMDSRTEALLYAAARRQHLAEKVLPALATDCFVLCDRFVDSSLVYQGYARGLGIEAVREINAFAIQEAMPKLTFLLDIDPVKGLGRITANKDREQNRLDMEDLRFHELVYEGYRMIQASEPERIKLINADRPLDVIAEEVLSIMQANIQTLANINI